MDEYKDQFVEDFFSRTLRNLQLYHDCMDQEKDKPEYQKQYIYETTQMINSFLGLIVLVNKTDFDKLNDVPDLEQFIENNPPQTWDFHYLDRRNHSIKREDKCFKNYLKHLRNAVTHNEGVPGDKGIAINGDPNVLTHDGKKVIKGITFTDRLSVRDRSTSPLQRYDNRFEATLSTKEIGALIILIAKAMAR